MMSLIKGITVKLHTEVQSGSDPFGNPIYTETVVSVDNVLVGEPSTDDIVNSTQLYGKKLVYVLGIPKGDTNDWTDKVIEINGNLYKSFGYPTEGIEENIPLWWNKKVKVERYG